MSTNMAVEKLNEFDKLIQEWAKRFGLDYFPQEFDIIPSEKMAEVMACGFPVTFSHWSHGRDYELIKTLWRHDRFSLPMEVVFNTDPCRGYICETDPFVIMILVMAHVYGHNDFFKNNFWLQHARTDINRFLADAAKRFDNYSEEYGRQTVEDTITAALAIQWNIEPFMKNRQDPNETIEAKITAIREKAKKEGTSVPDLKKLRADLKKQLPFKPDRDVIGFLIESSPVLEDWQRDVLSVIREQAYHLFPQIRTKVMNEGWAVFWHEKIMAELIKAGLIPPEDCDIYGKVQSRVLANPLIEFNPYYIGREIWKHIEAKHGLAKAFEVRKSYRDIEFVEEFLEDELIHKIQLYIFDYVDDEINNERVYFIVDKNAKRIREKIVSELKEKPNAPVVRVAKSNFNKEGELLLVHDFNEDAKELDTIHLVKTLEHLYFLWGQPVWLQTREMSAKSSTGFTTMLYGYGPSGIRRTQI